MSNLERKILEIELQGVKEILDFHVKLAQIQGMTPEREAHIDAILDLMNEYLIRSKNDNNE